MIQPNPEIQQIIEKATEYAVNKNHDYVTLEHLILAMVTSEPFHNVIVDFGCDVEGLATELNLYLDRQTHLISKGYDIVPKKTHSLERVFNRAFTQVLFSGRQQMQTIDIFLSIMSEEKSHARYYLTKYGLDRKHLVDFWNKHHVEPKSHTKKGSRNVAENILNEYCDNLNEFAEAGIIDPVIGREVEIDEISQVLAKRNKSNILMVGDPGVGKTAIA